LDLLAAWADREETMLAEAAVTAMAHAGEPARAVPVLVGHAGGPASRVAVAALARCCRSTPPSLLGPLLEEALTAPGSKVTLRKLAARQLGRNRPPGAVDVLLRAWEDPGLHRDVRVAVASVLRTIPEDPRTLDALGDAAGPHAGEPMLRTLFQAHPMEYAPAARPRYADLVRRLLMAADLPGVGFRGSKAFAVWAHWYRGGFDEIIEAVADPGTTGEGMAVFLGLLRAGAIRSQALDVLARLAAAVPGEDLRTPARQRVDTIARRLAAPLEEEPEPWRRRLARDAMDVLAAQPLLLPQVAELGVALLPGETDGDELADALCALADLLADRPVLAARTAGKAVSELFGEYGRRPPLPIAVALPPARRLAGRGDLSGGLFALMLTQSGGQRTEWASPWRELLRDLRASPHLEVRQEAWDTSVD
ncbi:HEAT repeat domain-containing protein, partial [Nonomuraea sp. NPDC003201]